MRYLIALGAVLVAGVMAWPAMAVGTATPFGAATVVDGSLQLVSNTGNADTADDFAGVTLSGTGVTTFSSITTLSTEYNVTDDDCKAGSPRFSIRVTTPSGPKNVFVYLGPSPNFTGCTPSTWLSSGNLITNTDPRFDISQIVPGGQYSTYAQALAAVGTYPVESIALVVDSGWAFEDKEQTVLIRNLKVNADTFYPYTPPPTTEGMNPAKACAALRTYMGVSAFRLKYGTNANRANAFGKCVSAMARMKSDAARTQAVRTITSDARSCLKAHGKRKALGQKSTKPLRVCLLRAG